MGSECEFQRGETPGGGLPVGDPDDPQILAPKEYESTTDDVELATLLFALTCAGRKEKKGNNGQTRADTLLENWPFW